MSRHQYCALHYGEGGLNFWHNDQSNYPFQALLMLSRPGEDFTGGEFCVKHGPHRPDEDAVCSDMQFQGDVVIFRATAGKGVAYPDQIVHGMNEVKKGSAAVCERWGIGIFHCVDFRKKGGN